MDQNALCQSDCRIFKLTISPEENDEKAWFFAYWFKLMEIKSCLKNVGVGVVKSGCGLSCQSTLKMAISQKRGNGINWFLVYW